MTEMAFNEGENYLKQTVNTFGQKRESNSTMSYFSNGVITRSDLKFRLRIQKKKQIEAFRNTMKDLTVFADIETLMDPNKCPTSISQNEEKVSQEIFSENRLWSLKVRTIASDSTAISPPF